MGGRGSGRRATLRWTLEHYHDLDVRYLQRHGCLKPGYEGEQRWLRGEQVTGTIGFVVAADTLTLSYRTRESGIEAWTAITEPVRLLRTAQHLGGERVWFACPGCGRRCAKLYGGRRFLCRLCVGVPYRSQGEAARDRKLRQTQAIRVRLGGTANLLEPFPDKPEGMRWPTYWRLRGIAQRLQEASHVAYARRLGILSDEEERRLAANPAFRRRGAKA